jgi:hypothetical protein
MQIAEQASAISLASAAPSKMRVSGRGWGVLADQNGLEPFFHQLLAGLHKPASLYEAFPAAEAAGWLSGSNGTTRQSTAVGWTWLNLSSASCRGSVSIDVSPTSRR